SPAASGRRFRTRFPVEIHNPGLWMASPLSLFTARRAWHDFPCRDTTDIFRHCHTQMNVIIIGAGVVGCAAAWEFLRQGASVTLLEGRSGPGLGTSHANGGQLSYDYVAPLADPGVFHDLPKWLLDPSSPLRFRPQIDLRQWCWLTAFLKACNASTAKASTTALLQLSYLSRDTLHAWLAETPLEFHHRRNGKLIAYRTPAL